MKSYSLGCGQDGWILYIEEVPSYAVFVSWIWNGACELTGMPSVMWKIPFGWPKWDQDEKGKFLMNSIAWKFYELEAWIMVWADDKRKDLAVIKITEEVAQQIDPEFISSIKREGSAR